MNTLILVLAIAICGYVGVSFPLFFFFCAAQHPLRWSVLKTVLWPLLAFQWFRDIDLEP